MSKKEIKEELDEFFSRSPDASDYSNFHRIDLDAARSLRKRADELPLWLDGLKEGEKITLYDFARGAYGKLSSKFKDSKIKFINYSAGGYASFYGEGFSVMYGLDDKHINNELMARVYVSYFENGHPYELYFVFNAADGVAKPYRAMLKEDGFYYNEPLPDKESIRLWKEYSDAAKKFALSNKESGIPVMPGTSGGLFGFKAR